MESVENENYKEKMMRELGFQVEPSAHIFFIALSERTYLFLDKVGTHWVFWKETVSKKNNYVKEYARHPSFAKVYDQAWRFMKWLQSEKEKSTCE